MDLSGIPPPVMNWDASNLAEEWKKFKLHVELIFKGPLKSKSEEEQVSYLLLWIGQQGRDVYKTWTGISEENAKKLETYYTRFKNHVQPKLNPIFARYCFNNEVQGSDSIDAFVTRLKNKAEDCSFTEKENMIRDRIVFGCYNEKCREKLINEGEKLTMDKAIQIVQNYEYCQKQLKSMTSSGASGGSGSNVDAVNRRNTNAGEGARPKSSQPNKGQRQQYKHCGNCWTKHEKKKCPAYGKTCYKCGKNNHYQKLCRAKQWTTSSVHGINNDDENNTHNVLYNRCENACSSEREFFIDTVSASNIHITPDHAYVPLHIGPQKKQINFKIDTGSSVDILPYKEFKSLSIKHPLQPPHHKLTSYTGNMLPLMGMVRLACVHKSKVTETMFYVVEGNAPPLISLQTSIDLGLLQLTYAVESTFKQCDNQLIERDYADLFKGIGVIPGEVKLHLKDDAVPVVNPPRRVPEALKSRLKDELDTMESDQIIQKVTEPTDWVNSLVVVEKPKTGKLRICLDPKALNEAIRRPHYPMSTLEDVTVKLTNATCFSILDITHAYWSIKLDENSSYLTTFSTPFGRYRYLRLPFGISASSDLFQMKCHEIFEGLPGMTAIVDDILIYGRTREEHDRNLRSVLDRAREKGIRFNPEKCTIGVNQVPFFGHILSDKGLIADPSKIEAILKLEVPDSRPKLERFLGMVNYLSKFAPHLAEITSPLRSLLKKETEFLWDEPQSRAFEKVKQTITQSPVLGYYDPKKELTLEVDSSKDGIGA